jgi:hypothetical protein
MLSSETSLDFIRGPTEREDGGYDETVAMNAVEDSVIEAVQYEPPKFTEINWGHLRMNREAFEAGSYGEVKPVSETGDQFLQ